MSNASMKILRKLPPAPKTATKTIRDPRFYSYGCHTFMYTPHIPGWAEDKASQERAMQFQERRKKEAYERQMGVVELAKQGLSDAEIAERTGYRVTTVNNIIGEFRRSGVEIPPRKKGRKAK